MLYHGKNAGSLLLSNIYKKMLAASYFLFRFHCTFLIFINNESSTRSNNNNQMDGVCLITNFCFLSVNELLHTCLIHPSANHQKQNHSGACEVINRMIIKERTKREKPLISLDVIK